jgi:hypothetical protein
MNQITKVILSSTIVGFIGLLLPSKVFAQVVINEVFPNPSGSVSEPNEFIELFNSGTNSVNITGWQISDTQGSTKIYTLPEATLDAGVYVSFRRSVSGIALNNDGDGVELRDLGGNLVDTMSFTQTLTDKSWSRIPNGTGNFVNNTDPSELLTNITPPTSLPTQIPTATPTSTPNKTSTPTPTITATSSPTKVPTPSSTKIPNLTPTLAPVEDLAGEEQTNQKQVLGIKYTSPSPTTSPPTDSKNSSTVLAFVLVGFGVLFIGLALYLGFKVITKSQNQNDI